MNVRTLISALSIALPAVFAGAAFAQATAPVVTTAPAAAANTATPVVDKREAKQEKRIDQGVASGQLTAKETHTLDKREAKLVADKTAAKADGKVTRAERRKLRQEAEKNSAVIHAKKHNDRTATAPTAAAPAIK